MRRDDAEFASLVFQTRERPMSATRGERILTALIVLFAAIVVLASV